MADKKALPPGENQGAPDETLEVTAPVPAGGGAVAKSPDETQSTVLQDPTRRRDTNTASLKRLRPQDFNAASDCSTGALVSNQGHRFVSGHPEKFAHRGPFDVADRCAVQTNLEHQLTV